MQRQLATSHSISRRNPMMTPTKSKLCNPGELKKPRQSRYFLFLLPLALAACSSMPSGPNVMVLPGKGVSFEQFRADDLLCRQYAASQTGTNSNDAAINSGVKSAALGTALGAAGGALIDGGHGAAVGAGVGLVFGGLTGAGSGTTSSYQAQLRYDNAYQQCMYSRGNSIPVTTNYSSGNTQNAPQRQPDYGPPPNTQTPPPARYIVPGQ